MCNAYERNSSLAGAIEVLEDRIPLSAVSINFDDLSAGAELGGNDGWEARLGGGLSALVDDTVYFGDSGKSVHVLDTAHGGSRAGMILNRYMDPVTDGSITLDYYMRANNSNDEGAFVGLLGPEGNDVFVAFGNRAGGAGVSEYIGIFNDVGWLDNNFLPYEVGRWYHVVRELDLETLSGSIRVSEVDDDGNDILSRSNLVDNVKSYASNESIDLVQIFTSGSQGADTYIDNITLTVPFLDNPVVDNPVVDNPVVDNPVESNNDALLVTAYPILGYGIPGDEIFFNSIVFNYVAVNHSSDLFLNNAGSVGDGLETRILDAAFGLPVHADGLVTELLDDLVDLTLLPVSALNYLADSDIFNEDSSDPDTRDVDDFWSSSADTVLDFIYGLADYGEKLFDLQKETKKSSQ